MKVNVTVEFTAADRKLLADRGLDTRRLRRVLKPGKVTGSGGAWLLVPGRIGWSPRRSPGFWSCSRETDTRVIRQNAKNEARS